MNRRDLSKDETKALKRMTQAWQFVSWAKSHDYHSLYKENLVKSELRLFSRTEGFYGKPARNVLREAFCLTITGLLVQEQILTFERKASKASKKAKRDS